MVNETTLCDSMVDDTLLCNSLHYLLRALDSLLHMLLDVLRVGGGENGQHQVHEQEHTDGDEYNEEKRVPSASFVHPPKHDCASSKR